MRRRTLIAFIAAALPLAALADYGADERADAPPADDGYDVSVDLNVQGAVTFESFHTALQPYGEWVVVGSYGRVWRPHVAAGWRPYYYGRWEWTNEGWLWVSDEPWGWAAYHYGRWAYDPYYGWLWVPGYEWAPAWVSWRASGDVIGWAPLAPGYSVYVSTYPFVDFWWTFVPCVRFVSVPVHTVAYAPAYTRRWFHATAPAPARAPRGRFGPAPAWGGPAPRLIEERIGRRVAPARIVRAPAPGERGRPGEIPVYRPERPGRDDRLPGRGERAAPEARPTPAPGEHGRGPGAVPAPGRDGRHERGGQTSPGPSGHERGGQTSPGPSGHERGGQTSPGPSGHGRGPGAAPAPGRGGRQERGDDGGGHRGGGQGGDRGRTDGNRRH